LAFLGQRPPADLARASLVDFWQWALTSWNLARVPRVRTAQVPVMSDG
jgi:glutamyl-Q tRNA(Asp) synthetase